MPLRSLYQTYDETHQDTWKWRALALSTSNLDEFILALQKIERLAILRRRKLALATLLVGLFMFICCGLTEYDSGNPSLPKSFGIAGGVMACSLMPITLLLYPLLASSHFVPTAFSVAQDLVFNRPDRTSTITYQAAAYYLPRLTKRAFYQVLGESAIFFAVQLFLLNLSTIISYKLSDPSTFCTMGIVAGVFTLAFFFFRLLSAEVLGSQGRSMQYQLPSAAPPYEMIFNKLPSASRGSFVIGQRAIDQNYELEAGDTDLRD